LFLDRLHEAIIERRKCRQIKKKKDLIFKLSVNFATISSKNHMVGADSAADV